ncbi:MAG: hypothetical protein QXJ14_02750 [Candidatus Aenigmatarchaeota archaeon]
MKCDLCRKTDAEREIITITRLYGGVEKQGYICDVCYKNFYRFPNKIVQDYSGKFWYISDPRKFGSDFKLTFGFSLEQAYREFSPYQRSFHLANGDDVAYFWLIFPGKRKYIRFTYGIGYQSPRDRKKKKTRFLNY